MSRPPEPITPQRRPRRPPSPLLLLAAGLPAVLALFIYLIWYFPVFFVKKVEVRGQRVLRQKEVVAALALKPQASLYALRLTPLKKRVRQNPWVQDVRMQRKFPNTLRVFLLERKPVAQLKVAQPPPPRRKGLPKPPPTFRYYVLDKGGLLLTVRTAPWPEPLVTFVGGAISQAKIGQKVVAGHLKTFLDAVQDCEAYAPGQIARFQIEKGKDVVMIAQDGLPIRLGAASSVRQKIPYLKHLLEQVKLEQKRTGAKVVEVDFSSADYPRLVMDRPVQPGE